MLRWLFPILVIVMVGYMYVVGGTTCQVPMMYKIGNVDERFHLTASDTAAAIAEAEVVWEQPRGRNLFTLTKTTPTLTINFVFDERQERILSEASLRQNLDTKEYTTEEIKAQYDKLSATYATMKTAYDTAVAHYETRLSAYNDRVAAFNKDQKASEDTYLSLTKEKKLLEAELLRLQSSGAKLESLATQINDIGEKGNIIIEQYNDGVHTYNNQFGEPSEFTQGEYQSGTHEIDIYSFKSHAELVNVLAHELGHALGLDHVEGSSSIMYYLMANQPYPPKLSSADQSAFVATCGTSTSFLMTVRSFINRYIISYIYE
jgi:predicted  nucleic acid-binding Zn-ribbon protein